MNLQHSLPSLLTLVNALTGFACVCQLARGGSIETAAWLLVGAWILDMLDGPLARYLGVESRFGAALDSLADLVSFGVAPALFVARHSEPAALIYLAAVLLRLARFQVGAPGDHLVFQGLPSPAAAMLIAGWFLVFPELPVVVVSILLSFVMLSKIGYPDLPKHYLKGIRSRAELLLPLMLLIALGPARALLATFSCYCLLAPWLSGQVGKTRKV
ncbi:MAG: CDP-alcohol phosphatidyltransferase family protein [Vulcanimicrobiota bacterium]